MLKLQVEWIDAPGVANKVLAETWGQLTITVTDLEGQQHVLSRLLSTAARSERTGIYGSVFPLAEWVIENWWFILHEPSRMPELPSGRLFSGISPALDQWAKRHNLLAARHGGALPDVSLYRDHEHIVARWFADPDSEQHERPVRFIGAGEVRLCPKAVEHGLQSFILQVLSRLDSEPDFEVERLRAEWKALCESRRSESELCGWAASMGLDPYDSSELDESLVETLEGRLHELEPELRTDLVEATSAKTVVADLNWIEEVRRKIGPSAACTNGFDWTGGASRRARPKTAHQWGYDFAKLVRENLRLQTDPIEDLPKLLHDRCHWTLDAPQVVERHELTCTSAMVAPDSKGIPRVVWPGGGSKSARFLLARSLFFVPLIQDAASARLMTKAYTWEQAASRAFAAELLAPADALRAEAFDGISEEQLEAVAARFQVSTMVIEYQLKNHRIGWVDES